MTAVAPAPPRARRRFTPPGTDTGTYWLLLGVIVVLNLVGLVMVLSSSSVVALDETGSTWSYFLRQLLWAGLGTVGLVVCMHLDRRLLRRLAFPAMLGTVGLLVLVLVPGVGAHVNGSTRWLALGPVQIQPSEFAKLTMLLFVADLLCRRSDSVHLPTRVLRPALGWLALTSLLILMQPNLGTTIVIAAIVFTALFVGGVSGRSLAGYGAVAAAGATMLALYTPYRRARVLAFLNPWNDPQNTGYQVIQSMVGIANGGVGGTGLGASRAKWGFLPYAHTDFIFAIVGEELGLVGALGVVALFLAVGVLGTRVALRAGHRFDMLVAAGITAWFMVQAFVNIGAVIGLLPITGVPLPFISFGGSSLLVNLAATGLLLNIARHPRADGPVDRLALD